MPRPASVDDYIDALPPVAREHLNELRTLSREAAPNANEAIKWGYPAYVHAKGVILFMFSGHKNHVSVAFTPSTRTAFDDELTRYETGKGTVSLPYGDPVPSDLLRRMIAYRIREFENDGVKWM
jgi:uncharacterized protein YdhG (YjbR/CyaY superfamily)